MKLNQTSQDFMDNLTRFIEILSSPTITRTSMDELDLLRRDLIDYLISTDPRKGVFVEGKKD